MRRWVMLIVGVVIGQWLAFAGVDSSASAYRAGMSGVGPAGLRGSRTAAEPCRGHAPRQSELSLPPGPRLHAARTRSLGVDAYRLALSLQPAEPLARPAHDELTRLVRVSGVDHGETIAALEPGPGVWITSVTISGDHQGRFLVDTGASVTLIGPEFAERAGIRPAGNAARLELHTPAGPTTAPTATVTSIAVGDTEIRDTQVVIPDPGSGVDGLLGNAFLNQYVVTVDAERSALRLRPAGRR
jgi:clan AA aspartic protease (TIGR02281 family)